MNNLFLLLFLLAPAFSFVGPDKTATCSAPENVGITSQSSGSISFDWNDCGCLSTGYRMWYFREEDRHTSQAYQTGNSNYTFSNLPVGTYDFFFATVCGSEVSGIVIIEDLGIN